jgi:hypothetical protein
MDPREKYEPLMTMNHQTHRRAKSRGTGHDREHDFMVSQYGALIADDPRLADLAWIFGQCHSTDRLAKALSADADIAAFTEQYVREMYLPLTDCTAEEIQLVVEAVLNHHQLNDRPTKDNPVTVVGKDADRLANIGTLLFLRSTRHYTEDVPKPLPLVDYVHLTNSPTATYRAPETVLKDIWYSLEWQDWLRMPKAIELARKRFALHRALVDDAEAQLREVGLFPYPFESEPEE